MLFIHGDVYRAGNSVKFILNRKACYMLLTMSSYRTGKHVDECSSCRCYLNSCSDMEAASLRSGRGFVKPSFPFKKYVMTVPFPY